MALANARLSGHKRVFGMMLSVDENGCSGFARNIGAGRVLDSMVSSYFLCNKYPTGHYPERMSDESDSDRTIAGENGGGRLFAGGGRTGV